MWYIDHTVVLKKKFKKSSPELQPDKRLGWKNAVLDLSSILFTKLELHCRHFAPLCNSEIYAEKFEFQNSVTMEDKQCKQIEGFSAMPIGSDYFCSLDDKSKQRYEVKINIIPYRRVWSLDKKEELSGGIGKFPLVTYTDIVNYFFIFIDSTD